MQTTTQCPIDSVVLSIYKHDADFVEPQPVCLSVFLTAHGGVEGGGRALGGRDAGCFAGKEHATRHQSSMHLTYLMRSRRAG